MSGRRGRPPRRPAPPSSRSRSWGWHRLDDDIASDLVALSGVGPGDLVLDLGAGLGAITRPLIASGARVIAFELHPGRSTALSRRVGDRAKVVRADVTDLRLPRSGFHVVANPPFDGVSAVIERLTHRSSRLERADLILPVSVARRWRDRLTADPSRRFALAIERPLPRSAFVPRPRIDTCVGVIARVEPGRSTTPRRRR